ncbi:MAG: hypothetical protein ACI9HY_004458 [Planctomycetaceae bacterium]|jgi:hypothetical protein
MLALFLRLLQKPRLYAESDWLALWVPGMGTILWGVSPLYIIWKVFINVSNHK